MRSGLPLPRNVPVSGSVDVAQLTELFEDVAGNEFDYVGLTHSGRRERAGTTDDYFHVGLGQLSIERPRY